MATDDGWKDDNEIPLDIHILFIEGYCQAPWMETSFVNCPPVIGDTRPFSCHSTFRVWCTDPSELGTNEVQPDAFGVKRAQDEIRSGKYHAIVVMDYSNMEERNEFESAFGNLLQEFVAAGGVVAFTSSEGLPVTTTQKYFDTDWTVSNYYRTTWFPCLMDNERNVNYSFGNGNLSRRIIKEFSCKGMSLRVPKHERCFGVTENSTTQSMVPHMSGRDVSKESEDDNYDVIIAMHDYGKGVIAYFGDVNAEHETIWLVAAFVESRSPKLPIDCFSRIDDQAFSEILQLKEEGNASFKNGSLDEAMTSYDAALDKFGKKLGTNGPQRDCYVALLSNASLIQYKKGNYRRSEEYATKVLDIEWGHEKCSYRRAMARFKISQGSEGGDLILLRKAKRDVLNAGRTPPSTLQATQKLLQQIGNEIKRLETKERRQFSTGFQSALSGKLG